MQGFLRQLVLQVVIGCAAALAQSPYYFDHLETSSAFPATGVFCVASDYEGYLWIGTAEGLFRYDGHRFSRFLSKPGDETSIAGNSIRSILPAKDGSIWIGTYGQGVSKFDPGRNIFVNYALRNSVSSATQCGRVWHLVQAGDELLAGTEGGLFRYDKEADRFEPIWPDEKPGNREITSNWTHLYPSSRNGCWIHQEGVLYFYNALTQEFYSQYNNSEFSPLFKIPDIGYLAENKDGKIWYVDRETVSLTCFDPSSGSFETRSMKELVVQDPSRWIEGRFILSGESKIWFTNRKGAQFVYDWQSGRCDSLFFVNKTPGTAIKELLFDVSESLDGQQFLAGRGGLYIESPPAFETTYLNPNHSDIKDDINSVVSLQNGTYYSSKSRVMQLRENGRTDTLFHLPFHSNQPESENIRRLCSTSDNAFVILTTNRIYEFNSLAKTPFTQQFDFTALDFSFRHTQSYLKDSRGRTWIGSWTSGLILSEEDGGLRHFHASRRDRNTLPLNCVISLAENPLTNEILAGFNAGKGIWKYDENQQQFLPYLVEDDEQTEKKLPGGVINDMHFLNGLLYIATHGSGLIIWDDATQKLTQIELSQGLPGNYVHAIESGKAGELILRTNRGICGYQADTGNITVYNDWFPQLEPLLNTALATRPSGDIWMVQDNALIRVNSNAVSPMNRLKPPVINLIDVEGKSYFKLPSEPLELSYSENTVSIQYSAMVLNPGGSQPEYAYQLNDEEWKSLGSTPELALAGLAPDAYTVGIRYKHPGGEWSETGMIRFSISPPFWKTNGFLITATLLFVLGIFGITRYRYERKIREIKLRNQLAGDLHDDIGSTLSSINIYSKAAISKLEHPREAEQILHKISSSAGETMERMSDIVWSIHPSDNDLAELCSRIRNFASEVVIHNHMRVEFDLVEQDGYQLKMEARKNIYLLAKEAINNAVKYSAARRVRISIVLKDRQLHLTVQDDGQGFDVALIKAGNGMRTLKERAQTLGGRCEIISEPGKGCAVHILIPLANIRD